MTIPHEHDCQTEWRYWCETCNPDIKTHNINMHDPAEES